jgi:hypothetical protein
LLFLQNHSFDYHLFALLASRFDRKSFTSSQKLPPKSKLKPNSPKKKKPMLQKHLPRARKRKTTTAARKMRKKATKRVRKAQLATATKEQFARQNAVGNLGSAKRVSVGWAGPVA